MHKLVTAAAALVLAIPLSPLNCPSARIRS
jgi:hypothetical protein